MLQNKQRDGKIQLKNASCVSTHAELPNKSLAPQIITVLVLHRTPSDMVTALRQSSGAHSAHPLWHESLSSCAGYSLHSTRVRFLRTCYVPDHCSRGWSTSGTKQVAIDVSEGLSSRGNRWTRKSRNKTSCMYNKCQTATGTVEQQKAGKGSRECVCVEDGGVGPEPPWAWV